jgi:simple sugar transport system ATP-binding protein
MHNNIILEGRNLTKKYGGVTALDDVTFKLQRNEVVGLLGDNGAGKSTLVKILSGAISPTKGKVFVEGKEVKLKSTRDAMQKGVEAVYQDLALIDCLSIEKNIYLGKEIVKKYLFVDVLQNKLMEKGAVNFLKEVGIDISDPTQIVSHLSGGQRHAVAISKAAFWTKKILILDEPTAGLGVGEIKKLLDIILELKKKGLSIILITHNIEHAFITSDRFFILRNGKKIGELKKENTNPDEIVKLITGAVFVRRDNDKIETR